MAHTLHKKPLLLSIILVAICVITTTAYAFTSSTSLFSGKVKVVPNALYAKQIALYEIFLDDVLPNLDSEVQTQLRKLFSQNIFDLNKKVTEGDQQDQLRDLLGRILDRSMNGVGVEYAPIISPFDIRATSSDVELVTNEKVRVILKHLKSNTASSTAFVNAVIGARSVGEVYRELYSGKYFAREISSKKEITTTTISTTTAMSTTTDLVERVVIENGTSTVTGESVASTTSNVVATTTITTSDTTSPSEETATTTDTITESIIETAPEIIIPVVEVPITQEPEAVQQVVQEEVPAPVSNPEQ
ncbi:MAG: hypothetical protein RIT04_416 [Candidatus Parcubacteria bacterium]|jgi:hypothetical protein